MQCRAELLTDRFVDQGFADLNCVFRRIGSVDCPAKLFVILCSVPLTKACVKMDAVQVCVSVPRFRRQPRMYLWPSTLSANSSSTIPSQRFSPASPHPMSLTVGSSSLIACAHCRALVAYASAVCFPICHSPHTSLPSPQNFTS